MSRRAVQTEVNAKGNRSPGWILGSAVKAYLYPGVVRAHIFAKDLISGCFPLPYWLAWLSTSQTAFVIVILLRDSY